MRKLLLSLGIIIGCLALLIILLNVWVRFEIKKTPYLSGKDTYLYLGDGRFQIGKTYHDYGLFDGKNFLTIDSFLSRYYHDGENKILYTEGQNGFTVTNYGTGDVQQHKELSEYERGIQDIFNSQHFISLKSE